MYKLAEDQVDNVILQRISGFLCMWKPGLRGLEILSQKLFSFPASHVARKRKG
jgi:hypothetical protein